MSLRRPSRGYLMIEVLLGGAILSIVLATSISLIVDARHRASDAGHRQVATELARAKAHELRGDAHVLVTQTVVDVGAEFPGLRWSWTIQQSGMRDRSAPALASNDTLHEIVVRVEYPTHDGPRTVELRTFKAKAS